MLILKALSTGETVCTLTSARGRIGEIHSTFDHSVNVVTKEKRLFTIICKDLGDSPINLKVDSEQFGQLNETLREGDPVYMRKDKMSLGYHAAIIGLEDAAVWIPQPKLPESINPTLLLSNLRSAAKSLRRHGRSQGLKSLLSHIETLIGIQSTEETESNPYVKFAYEPFKDLQEYSIKGDVGKAANNASKLVGLGPGLTPSGDDFLCGFTGTLSMTSSYLKHDEREEIKRMNSSILEDMKGRTNLISEEYLIHYANGKPSRMACTTIESIVLGPEHAIKRKIEELCNYGHSSGTDIALGIISGFYVLYRKLETGR